MLKGTADDDPPAPVTKAMVVRTIEIDPNSFTPRDYQIELLEKALQYNTIIPLGTGSGKTFIAVLLIKEYAQLLLAPYSKNGQRAVFLVDKVTLVDQQANHIECHTELKVARLHGNMNTALWSSKKAFDELIEDKQVLVLTAQIFVELLDHALFSFERVPVVVMDECHHVLGSRHPYRLIVQRYGKLSEDSRPRILGLTASLINNKISPSSLEALLRKLETVMHCRIEAATDLVSVAKYGAKPKEYVINCRNYDLSDAFIGKVCSFLTELRDFALGCREFHPDLDVDPRKPIIEATNRIMSILRQMGPWCAWRVSLLWQRQLKKIHSGKSTILGEKQVLFLHAGETTISTVTKILEKKVKHIRSYEELIPFIPHKVQRLIEILIFYNPENQKKLEGGMKTLSSVVFVEQRYVAYVMNILMKSLCKWNSELFSHIKSDFIIGFSGSSLGDESVGFHSRQESVLNKFRQNALNILFTTSVLEEGVDVKHCNLVIRFDPPDDFRSYVQSRGRARRAGAQYMMLVEEKNKYTFANDLQDFCEIERMILNRAATVDSPEPVADFEDVDNVMDPYVVESTGAKVTMSTAIALVNRYCSRLPSDVFTRLVPHHLIEPVIINGVTKFVATLTMPINSPYKEQVKLTSPMPTKKLAQMAVALEACRQLHQKQELNDNLLPAAKDAVAATFLFDDDPDEYVPHMAYKAGSMRRKQLYDKRLARGFSNTLPVVGEPAYLYVFEMDLLKTATGAANPKHRKIVNPLENDYFFGFLSNRILPEIPAFPVYPRQGKVLVNIRLTEEKVTLDDSTLMRAHRFHEYLFEDVLVVIKQNLAFLPSNSPIGTLIVPLKRRLVDGTASYSLDYEYLSNVLEYKKIPCVPSEEERSNFQFVPENYEDAVVVPWYRAFDVPAFFAVAAVKYDLNPLSKFPDDNYNTFKEYYLQRYKLNIFNESQPLLDVDYTSNRMNLIMPRIPARNQGRERKVEKNTQHQIIVPELVNIHPIAASLWNMIITLPTIIYRTNSLLLANELRELICTEALKSNDAERCHNWEPLDYPTSYSDDVGLPVNRLTHLKKAIEAEEAKEKALNPQKVCERAYSDIEIEESDESFAIGVWDPDLANTSDFDPMINTVVGFNTSKGSHQSGMADDELDAAGAGMLNNSLGDGEMSDNENEDSFLFDYLHSFKQDAEQLLVVRDDIEECGWDMDAADLQFSAAGGVLPISFTGLPQNIDQKGLMKDLESLHFKDAPVSHPASTQNVEPHSPKKDSEGAAEPEQSKNATVNTGVPVVLDRQVYDDRDIRLSKPGEDDSVNLLEYIDNEEEKKEVESISTEIESRRVKLTHLPFLDTEKPIPEAPVVEFDDYLLGRSQSVAPKVNAYKDGELKVEAILNENERHYVVPETIKLEFAKEDQQDYSMGVSPCILLQALTLSHAGDGLSLERLETVGDSFLKFAVTDYLYHEHKEQHEGKLSFARSKEVSNYNLYRLGKRKGLPSIIVAAKFDPHDGWLPPCYVPTTDFRAPNAEDAEETDKYMDDVLEGRTVNQPEKVPTGWDEGCTDASKVVNGIETINFPKNPQGNKAQYDVNEQLAPLPYNTLTQQYISDKSIADSVEALIGAHLLNLGSNAALQFMRWLGIRVIREGPVTDEPLLRYLDTVENPTRSAQELCNFVERFQLSSIEHTIGYTFRNKAYLLQAFTHASYYRNRVTGCYQRLEFLGDAVLDYMITRYLYQHKFSYSPGVLTDLRSALVNNTIFASLAVKYNFHKHFLALCPGLHHMIEKFVKLCKDQQLNNANFNSEMYMVTEEEIDEGEEEEIEVPKALGDIFESLAGAVYLDCGRNLDIVWKIFYNLMHETVIECCKNPPKSPIRELLELEPEKARFSKMERIRETGKVRVTVDIQNKCRFTGMGRNYRIAKCTAAKRALRYLRCLKIEKEREAAKKQGAEADPLK